MNALNNEVKTVSRLPTPRQKEVLRLMAEGLQNKEIASRLDLSVSTIKMHINAVYVRLGVKTRVAAVVKAHNLGFLC